MTMETPISTMVNRALAGRPEKPWRVILASPLVLNIADIAKLVGGFNHLEKYEFVNGKDYPIYGKIKNIPNHRPVNYRWPHKFRWFMMICLKWRFSRATFINQRVTIWRRLTVNSLHLSEKNSIPMHVEIIFLGTASLIFSGLTRWAVRRTNSWFEFASMIYLFS